MGFHRLSSSLLLCFFSLTLTISDLFFVPPLLPSTAMQSRISFPPFVGDLLEIPVPWQIRFMHPFTPPPLQLKGFPGLQQAAPPMSMQISVPDPHAYFPLRSESRPSCSLHLQQDRSHIHQLLSYFQNAPAPGVHNPGFI